MSFSVDVRLYRLRIIIYFIDWRSITQFFLYVILKLQVLLVHEEYQQYVLPKIAESKKLAKAGRAKGREADAEYNQAKQVEKNIW